VSANLPSLIQQFGPLKRVWLGSIYPQPSQGWKQERSFLLDKYVHDIDVLLHWLPQGDYEAERLIDSSDHYEVKGRLGGVEINCVGTRLHRAEEDFIEVIMLGFSRGEKGRSSCAVYTKTGLIRYYDGDSERRWKEHITPMKSEGYDRVFAELMRNFAASIGGEPGTHTFDELLTINRSAVALAGPAGSYRSR
jgi:predicted dehydrogenase